MVCPRSRTVSRIFSIRITPSPWKDFAILLKKSEKYFCLVSSILTLGPNLPVEEHYKSYLLFIKNQLNDKKKVENREREREILLIKLNFLSNHFYQF